MAELPSKPPVGPLELPELPELPVEFSEGGFDGMDGVGGGELAVSVEPESNFCSELFVNDKLGAEESEDDEEPEPEPEPVGTQYGILEINTQA